MSALKELNSHESVLSEREKILLKLEEIKSPIVRASIDNTDIEKWKNFYSKELAVLRDWIRQQHRLLQGVSDTQVLAFLHSCGYNIEQTKSKIELHYTIRTETPEIFLNRCLNLKEMSLALRVTRISFLQNGTPEGYNAIYVDSLDPDPTHFDFLEAVKVTSLVIDALVLSFPRVEGNVLICDMQNSGLAHMTKINFPILKKGMIFAQRALPLLLKEVHVINASPLIHHIHTMIKPFIDNNLSNIIHIHMQGSMETFYKSIPEKYLPKDYGGEAKSLQELHDQLNEMIRRHEGTLKTMENWVIEGCKRDVKGLTNGELDMTGTVTDDREEPLSLSMSIKKTE